MSITLDHTVLSASDNESAARRFADIMGVELDGQEGVDGKFVSGRVSGSLRLFFVTSQKPASQHLAFVVDDPTFDRILRRLRETRVRPRDTQNSRIDHPLAPRGLFWTDPDRHLFEVMTSANC